MVEALLTGILLGLSAGIAPGPLLALVISETLRHGAYSGIKVALAPLITDLPIVVGALIVVQQLSGFDLFLGVISLVGAGFVTYLGIDAMRVKEIEISDESVRPRSLVRGVLTNLLSPHPYLFWFAVGAPVTITSHAQGLAASSSFIAAFYLLLVGCKIVLALVSARSRALLKGRAYHLIMKILGVLLCLFALLLVRDGLAFLGWHLPYQPGGAGTK
jgi:threonine/homoserine/homoserine lactone efflux protein